MYMRRVFIHLSLRTLMHINVWEDEGNSSRKHGVLCKNINPYLLLQCKEAKKGLGGSGGRVREWSKREREGGRVSVC